MDTFTITAYDKSRDVVTIDFSLQAQGDFAGGTFTKNMTELPKDSVDNVKALLNTPTEF